MPNIDRLTVSKLGVGVGYGPSQTPHLKTGGFPLQSTVARHCLHHKHRLLHEMSIGPTEDKKLHHVYVTDGNVKNYLLINDQQSMDTNDKLAACHMWTYIRPRFSCHCHHR